MYVERGPRALNQSIKNNLCARMRDISYLLKTAITSRQFLIVRSFKSTHVTVCVSCINVYQPDLFTTLH